MTAIIPLLKQGARKRIVAAAILMGIFYSSPTLALEAKDRHRFEFVVMGCMHLGVTDMDDYALAIERIKTYKPDFILLSGGMIDPYGKKPVASLWREFDRVTKKSGVRAYDVDSDCRLYPFRVSEERLAAMEASYLDRYKKHHYSFLHKNNFFIFLASGSQPWADTESQRRFLEDQLAHLPEVDHVFLVVNTLLREGSRDAWMKNIHPLIKGKVQYVFSSGTHAIHQERMDGVFYVTSGCPPAGIEEVLGPGATFSNFLHVGVFENKVTVGVVPIGSLSFKDMDVLQKDGAFVASTLFRAFHLRAAELSSVEREAIMQPARVVEALHIKPGMIICDIGAGPGFFTIPFARALNGTGQVVATDIDPRAVKYVKKKAQEEGVSNIITKRVKRDGVDDFYKTYAFDIIFLSEVYDGLLNPEAYFSALKSSLKKDGRLIIIHAKNASPFSEAEFGDFKKVFEILKEERVGLPVLARLSQTARDYVARWTSGADIPPGARAVLVEDFNAILTDRSFCDALNKHYSPELSPGRTIFLDRFFARDDALLANWLIYKLDEGGVFEQKGPISKGEEQELRMLNRVILCSLFKSDVLKYVTTRRACVGRDRIVSVMDRAGYRFTREEDFIQNYYFLEFKKK